MEQDAACKENKCHLKRNPEVVKRGLRTGCRRIRPSLPYSRYVQGPQSDETNCDTESLGFWTLPIVRNSKSWKNNVSETGLFS
jgi:hypothetical protein